MNRRFLLRLFWCGVRRCFAPPLWFFLFGCGPGCQKLKTKRETKAAEQSTAALHTRGKESGDESPHSKRAADCFPNRRGLPLEIACAPFIIPLACWHG